MNKIAIKILSKEHFEYIKKLAEKAGMSVEGEYSGLTTVIRITNGVVSESSAQINCLQDHHNYTILTDSTTIEAWFNEYKNAKDVIYEGSIGYGMNNDTPVVQLTLDKDMVAGSHLYLKKNTIISVFKHYYPKLDFEVNLAVFNEVLNSILVNVKKNLEKF